MVTLDTVVPDAIPVPLTDLPVWIEVDAPLRLELADEMATTVASTVGVSAEPVELDSVYVTTVVPDVKVSTDVAPRMTGLLNVMSTVLPVPAALV